MELSVDLLKSLQDCLVTMEKLSNLLWEDREDMPGCISGEILQEYLRGADRAQEILSSLRKEVRAILAGS